MGFEWTAAGRDRDDAGTFTAAHDTVVVLATPHRGYPQVINNRAERCLNEFRVSFDSRAQFFEDMIRLVHLALRMQQGDLGECCPDVFTRGFTAAG